MEPPPASSSTTFTLAAPREPPHPQRAVLLAAIDAALAKRGTTTPDDKKPRFGKEILYPRIEPQYWAAVVSTMREQYAAELARQRDVVPRLPMLALLTAAAESSLKTSIQCELELMAAMAPLCDDSAAAIVSARKTELGGMAAALATNTFSAAMVADYEAMVVEAATGRGAREHLVDTFLAHAPAAEGADMQATNDDGLPLAHAAFVKAAVAAIVMAGALVKKKTTSPPPPTASSVAAATAKRAGVVGAGLVGGIPAAIGGALAYALAYSGSRVVSLVKSAAHRGSEKAS